MVFRFLWPEHFFPPSWRHKCPAERKPGRLTCSEIALRTFFRVRSRLCAQKARCDSMICAVWRQQTQLVSSRVSGGKSSIVSRCSATRRTHTRTGARPCAHINSARVSQCKSGWETRPGPARPMRMMLSGSVWRLIVSTWAPSFGCQQQQKQPLRKVGSSPSSPPMTPPPTLSSRCVRLTSVAFLCFLLFVFHYVSLFHRVL